MTHQDLDQFSRSKSIEVTPAPQTITNDRSELSSILRPAARVALAVTLMLIPVRYRLVLLDRPIEPIYGDYTNFLIFGSDLILIAALAFWALSLAIKPRRINFEPKFLSLPMIGLIGWSLLTSFLSLDPPLSLYHTFRLLILGCLYLFIVNEESPLKFVLIPIGIQVLVQASIGIAQYLTQSSLGLQSIGELTLDPEWQGVSIVWAGGVRSLRAYGLSDHPNLLGGSLAFGLFLILVWYHKSRIQWRPIVTAIFAMGVLGLLLTFSRSAWLAISVGYLFAGGLLLKNQQKDSLLNWITPGLAGAIISIPFLWANVHFLGARINWHGSFQEIPHENQAIGERQLLIHSGNQIFLENPITGIGLGAFPQALRIAQPDFPVDYQPAHLTLLDAATEIGIFGALLYTLLIINPWIALFLRRNSLDWSPEFILVTGLLLAVTIVGFFDYYTWILVPGQQWQWFIWGLWGSLFQSSLRERPHV